MCRGMNGWRATRFRAPGGLAGHLLGTGLFLPLAGRSAVLAFSGLGYLLALVYAAGMRPRPFCRAMLREWRAWRMNRKEKKLARQTALLAREAARVRASMEDAALSAPRPVRKGRASVPRLQRTGDDLESLYHEAAAVAPSKPEDSFRLPAPREPRAAFPWLRAPGLPLRNRRK